MTGGARPPALVLAAPASSSGKTLVTLGLLRAFAERGVRVAGAKAGPDYIDPRFHEAACGRPSVNLDAWAMRPGLLHRLADPAAAPALLLVEGVMGLFDGARGGPPGALAPGSTADLAARFGWPVVLVVDARGMAQSLAALVAGFRDASAHVQLAGVIANRIGGPRHRDLLAEALAPLAIPFLGGLATLPDLAMPSRHLGLVQAGEHPAIQSFVVAAAAAVAAAVDLDRLVALARPGRPAPDPLEGADGAPLPPPGQRIAVAQDVAFAFAYPHLLDGWRAAGAEIRLFSPLADEAPAADADSLYLPGGYPELHAGRLAANRRFLDGLRRHAADRPVYGECGGYMVLGDGLIDADGQRHALAGLLPVTTSFADRRLTLGYRRLALAGAARPFGPRATRFAGHEFHMATVVAEGPGEPLFTAEAADGTPVGPMGRVAGRVAGSFAHVIDVDIDGASDGAAPP